MQRFSARRSGAGMTSAVLICVCGICRQVAGIPHFLMVERAEFGVGDQGQRTISIRYPSALDEVECDRRMDSA